MDSNETTEALEQTDAQQTEQSQATEAQGKMYSQQEFDDAMAKMKHAVLNKALKPYQELGDLDELKSLRATQEKAQHEEAMKKGEFEKILQDLASKKDAEIDKLSSTVKQYKVDTPLMNAAAKYRAVNPEQVVALVKSNVRLGEDGDVEVIGTDGSVQYLDNGTPMGVDDYVKRWLDTNPHFVSPTPATTNTRSNVLNESTDLDVSKLDMSNPEHRKMYAELRKQRQNA